MSFVHFLSYNNAVPIGISVLLLGAGGAFASTNPEAIYSESQRVIAIDNTYLVYKDLGTFNPRAQIVSVTEDDEHYYVAYEMHTIDLEDYVWRDVVKQEVMKVSKAMLGQYRDLGVYVTKQLKENIEQEQRRLIETQAIEQRAVSQKVVAVEYGGLIGKMLDTSTQTLPGYTPVVVEPVAPSGQIAAVSEANSPSQSQPVAQEAGAPVLQVLGNSPASVVVGTTYLDLGAVIVGPTESDRALGIRIFVNGTETAQPSIDTSKAGNRFIRYEATNMAGKKGVAERVVIITDPNAPTPEDPDAPSGSVDEPTPGEPQEAPQPADVVVEPDPEPDTEPVSVIPQQATADTATTTTP